MKEVVNVVLSLVFAAIVIGATLRAVEWVIPAPSTRIIFCTLDAQGSVDFCASARELKSLRGEEE